MKTNSKLLGTLAGICFVYFALALLVLHVLRPDYTPIDHMISDYAVGQYGWVMTTAFVAMAAGCALLAVGMVLNGPKSIWARLGEGLLAVAQPA